MIAPNPSGLCQCGCGEKTRLADRTYMKRGWVKDKPVKYIHGHNGYKSLAKYAINPETQCWEWQRSRQPGSYGLLPLGDTTVYAHRHFFEQKYGLLPEGYQVDHLCRNRACVNPEHMEAVTNSQNSQRGSNAKLTPEDVQTIRKMAGKGILQRPIASQFGIAQTHVSRIVTRRCWANVE